MAVSLVREMGPLISGKCRLVKYHSTWRDSYNPYKVELWDHTYNWGIPAHFVGDVTPYFCWVEYDDICFKVCFGEVMTLPWNSRWWFQIFFYRHSYLGMIPNIFQRGWNHRPDEFVIMMFLTVSTCLFFKTSNGNEMVNQSEVSWIFLWGNSLIINTSILSFVMNLVL